MKFGLRELRIVCYKGKYSFRWCETDTKGYVVSVPSGTVELKADSVKELIQLLEECMMNVKSQVCHVNDSNKKDLLE